MVVFDKKKYKKFLYWLDTLSVMKKFDGRLAGSLDACGKKVQLPGVVAVEILWSNEPYFAPSMKLPCPGFSKKNHDN